MHRPTLPHDDRSSAVEPGFADLPAPAFAGRDDGMLESGVRSLLSASAAPGDRSAEEPLPPGRITRPGEH